MKKTSIIFFCIIFCLSYLGCRSTGEKPYESELAGRYHEVKKGDTLGKIAVKYRVSIDEIMDVNGIDDIRLLRIGQALFLPDPDPIGTTINRIKERKKPRQAPKKKSKTLAQKPSLKSLSFPIAHGSIFKKFSKNKKNPYEGVGIRAQRGQPILAAMPGTVLYAGDDDTKYGLLVIIEHPSPFITVYTHLEKALVKQGQKVKRQQVIGRVGSSGGAKLPHLHFQVRVNERPEDPQKYLRKPNRSRRNK